MELTLQHICVGGVIIYSALGWLVLTGTKINYGRLTGSLSSIYINPKIGWFLFEIPNLAWAIYFLLIQQSKCSLAYFLFIAHYINRDIIYPLSLKSTTPIPLEIVLSAFFFTFANGYIQAIANQEAQQTSILAQILGFAVFVIGMSINIISDKILQNTKQKIAKESKQESSNLPKERGSKYVRVDLFLFKYVCNPNYFGEIIEWIGYSIASGHPYSLLFVFSTFNILIPAALVRSKWNKDNIKDYPKERKAIFPLLL